jgi:hypothetical protein
MTEHLRIRVSVSSTTPVGVRAGFQAALTDANGIFTFANAPLGRSVITIFGSAGYLAVLHQDATIAATSSSLPTYYVSKPTVTENGFLALIIGDRAKYFVKPLVLDEALMEAGRYWAQFMAKNQHFAHRIPASLCTPGSTTPNPAAYTPHDLTPTARATYFHEYSQIGNGEILAAGFTDYTGAEAAFMSESQYCPNGNSIGCAFTEQNGHFIDVTNPGYAFGGVGMAIDPVMNYPDDDAADRIRALAETVRVVWPGGKPTTVIGRRAGRRLGSRGDLVANRCKDALRRQAVGECWEIGRLACDRIGEGVE